MTEEERNLLTADELSQTSGLTLQSDVRCTEEELLDKMQEAFPAHATLILWCRNRLFWGSWDGKEAALSNGSALVPHLVQELRLFDEDGELHLTRCGPGFRGRQLRDLPAGTEDAQALAWDRTDLIGRFWGEEAERTDGSEVPEGYIHLVDPERSIAMDIPCSTAGAEAYGLYTRNYVGTVGDSGQASYVDFRFVRIVPMERKDAGQTGGEMK